MSTLPRLNFTSLSSHETCGDIVEAFRLAAESLGYPTRFTPCCIVPGEINILFFFWDVPWEQIEQHHPDCIVVNFEPMVHGTHAWNERYLDVLKRCYLWEYSKSNFQRHRQLGYRNADYVALGWEPGAAEILPLADILPDAQQDIDVVFFGSLTRRRIDILEGLMARGRRVEVNRGRAWTLEERNGFMRRAKVVLNLHNWEASRVVEVPRLSILLRHRKAVVCELYPDSEVEAGVREAVVGAPYERLIETIEQLLADAPRRAALEREALDVFSNAFAPPLVGPAIERFLGWRAQQPDRFVLATAMPRVTVCLTAGDSLDALSQSLRAWSTQQGVSLHVVLVARPEATGLDSVLAQAGIADAQLISLPVACDRATARNLALAQAQGDYVVFSDAGDIPVPERLQRQAALLQACAAVDIVGCWCGTHEGTRGRVRVRRAAPGHPRGILRPPPAAAVGLHGAAQLSGTQRRAPRPGIHGARRPSHAVQERRRGRAFRRTSATAAPPRRPARAFGCRCRSSGSAGCPGRARWCWPACCRNRQAKRCTRSRSSTRCTGRRRWSSRRSCCTPWRAPASSQPWRRSCNGSNTRR
jgi:hypothetical protein